MRYVIQLVCWLLRFMDKSSEDRVDAYSAQSAFFIIMGFIPFVMLLLILLQYTPMTKEDVMTLLKVIFPEGFHAVPGNVSRICVYKIHRIALWNGDHSSLGVQQGHDVCIQRTE